MTDQRSLERVLNAVRKERQHQDEKWGSQREHPNLTWLSILAEEFGEAAKEVNEHTFEGLAGRYTKSKLAEHNRLAMLSMELIQTAAVAVCWLEALNVRLDTLEDAMLNVKLATVFTDGEEGQ